MATLLNYPIVSWEFTLPLPLSVNVEANAVNEFVIVPAGTYYGFCVDPVTGLPTADTLLSAFATALVTHSQILNVSIAWDFSIGFPRAQLTILRVGVGLGDSIDWSASPAAMELAPYLGFDPTINAGIPVTGVVLAPYSGAGYWAPSCGDLINAECTDTLAHRAFYSQPPHVWSGGASPNYSVRRWSTDNGIRRLRIDYDLVDDAFIRIRRRQDPLYAARAGVSTSDQNNLLEQVLDAASCGAEFRVYCRQDEEIAATHPGPFDLGEWITPAGNSGARFAVTLNMRIVET